MLEKLACPSLEGRQKLFQLTIFHHVVNGINVDREERNLYSETCISWTLY